MQLCGFARSAGVVIALSAAASASGAFIPQGCFQLNNHPDGGYQDPGYGLILTELFNVRHHGTDVFSFDFDHAQSDMQLCWDGECIVISGTVFGGRDIGEEWADDEYKGVYEVYFKYSVIDGVSGDDDLFDEFQGDEGWIKSPGGTTVDLHSKSNGDYTFRLGDENDDLGHRGFNGISGWGWLTMGSKPYAGPSDWLFTVKIPTPGSVALLMAATPLVAIRRRRSA
ncbi:MAG: hypothetical protein KDA20_06255 [Phycisphaerales bacterium]|nr:hypothetical protein [Phycisphaerales bacterium]